MFEHPRLKIVPFEKQDVLHWLSWLASKMIEHNQIPYVLENMQPEWLGGKKQIRRYNLMCGLVFGLLLGAFLGRFTGLADRFFGRLYGGLGGLLVGLIFGLVMGLIDGLLVGRIDTRGRMIFGLFHKAQGISTIDFVFWRWNNARKSFLSNLIIWPIGVFILVEIVEWIFELFVGRSFGLNVKWIVGLSGLILD